MVLTDDNLNGVVGAAQDDIDENFTHGAIGTGSSGEQASDDSLDNEVLRKARADITDGNISNGTGSTTVSLFVNSTEANGETVSEVGFFDSSSGGEMQSRDVFNSVDKNNSIELFFDIDLNIEVTQG